MILRSRGRFSLRGLGEFRTGRLVEPLYVFDFYAAPQGAPLCIYPMQLRSLCVTERLVPHGDFPPSASDVFPVSIGPLPTPSLAAGGKAAVAFGGTITPALRSGLQRLTGAPGPFSARRRTILCMSPARRSAS